MSTLVIPPVILNSGIGYLFTVSRINSSRNFFEKGGIVMSEREEWVGVKE